MEVLIMDDSKVMRKIIEQALRHAGLDLGEVIHAANGCEGIAALETRAGTKDTPLGVILCDVHMPLMGGLDFLREKQRRNLAPGVPVVMITAESGDPEVLKAMTEGAHGYISKPFTLEQIQTSVTSLLYAAA